MTYNIKCPDFTRCAGFAKAFSKHYAKDENICTTKKGVEVIVGTNRFIFFHQGTRPGEIPLEEFSKKYFTQKKQAL